MGESSELQNTEHLSWGSGNPGNKHFKKYPKPFFDL